MKTFIPFVVLCALVSVSLADRSKECQEILKDQKLHNWENFKKEFNRHYDAEEDAKRKEIFLDNVKEVKKVNEAYCNGKSSWVAGINQFSDKKASEVPTGLKSIEKTKKDQEHLEKNKE